MKVGQILEMHKDRLHEPVTIEYRLMAIDSDGVMRDISLAGLCMYEGNRLTPLDGDSYSLQDEMDAHTILPESGTLVVWEDITNALREDFPVSENDPVEEHFGSVEKHIAVCEIDALRGA